MAHFPIYFTIQQKYITGEIKHVGCTACKLTMLIETRRKHNSAPYVRPPSGTARHCHMTKMSCFSKSEVYVKEHTKVLRCRSCDRQLMNTTSLTSSPSVILILQNSSPPIRSHSCVRHTYTSWPPLNAQYVMSMPDLDTASRTRRTHSSSSSRRTDLPPLPKGNFFLPSPPGQSSKASAQTLD